MQHGDNAFFQCSISPFSNTILLGAILSTVLSLDPIVNAEGFKLPEHVLATLIIIQAAQSLPSDVFHPCLELLKGTEGLRFLL
jgi:hypothetical protein